jgi:hypothetical protein
MLTVLPILVKMLQLAGPVQETAPQVLGKQTPICPLAKFGLKSLPKADSYLPIVFFNVRSSSYMGKREYAKGRL